MLTPAFFSAANLTASDSRAARPEQRALGLLELVAPHVVHERVTVVLPHARPVVACCHGARLCQTRVAAQAASVRPL